MGDGAWNPRYTLYARSQGRDEAGQKVHDEEEYPGGPGYGFSTWIREKWREFCSREGYCYEMRLCYQKEFDAWLPGNLGPNPEKKRVCLVRSGCGDCRIPGEGR